MHIKVVSEDSSDLSIDIKSFISHMPDSLDVCFKKPSIIKSIIGYIFNLEYKDIYLQDNSRCFIVKNQDMFDYLKEFYPITFKKVKHLFCQ